MNQLSSLGSLKQWYLTMKYLGTIRQQRKEEHRLCFWLKVR